VRKQDTTALCDARQLAATMTAIVDELGVSAIVCDLSNRVQYLNAAAERLYGYSAELARGPRLEHLICPGGSAEELGVELLDDSGRASLRPSHRRLDGTLIEVDLTIRLRRRAPVRRRDRSPWGVSGSWSGLTSSARASKWWSASAS
jgi:PAS domain S-box-containing protein